MRTLLMLFVLLFPGAVLSGPVEDGDKLYDAACYIAAPAVKNPAFGGASSAEMAAAREACRLHGVYGKVIVVKRDNLGFISTFPSPGYMTSAQAHTRKAKLEASWVNMDPANPTQRVVVSERMF